MFLGLCSTLKPTDLELRLILKNKTPSLAGLCSHQSFPSMGNLLCLSALQALHCSPLLHNVFQRLRLHCSTFYIQHSASTTHWIVYIVHIVCICIVAQHGVRPLLCLLCARVCIVLVFQMFCSVFVFCICRVGHHCVRPLLCLLSVHVLCLSTLTLLTNRGHEMAYI